MRHDHADRSTPITHATAAVRGRWRTYAFGGTVLAAALVAGPAAAGPIVGATPPPGPLPRDSAVLPSGPGSAPSPGAPATPEPGQSLPILSTRSPIVGGDRLTGLRLVTDLPAGVPAPPDFKAGAYLIADLDSGEIVATKGPHAMYLPASTMKALTALTLVSRLGPGAQVTAMPEDAAVDGTKVGMDPGAPYPIGSLFAALMMSSANDAAVALARANGGMQPTTAQMNAVAEHLGALDTTAKNTSGLDAPGQVTSVYDLALIGRAAIKDADVAPYLTRKSDSFPGGRTKKGQKRATMEIANHNTLLWNYDGTIGVKNGYTNAAGATYIGAVRRGEKAYIFSYLKGESGAWRPTAEMFDWAFAYGDKVGAVGRLVEPGELQAAAVAEHIRPGGVGAAAPADGSGPDALGAAVAKVDDVASDVAGHLPEPLRDFRVLAAGAVVLGAALMAVRLRRR